MYIHMLPLVETCKCSLTLQCPVIFLLQRSTCNNQPYLSL